MSQRYEREIEELLRRMNGGPRRGPRGHGLRHRLARAEAILESAWRSFLRRTPIEQFMIAGVVLALLSYALHPLSAKAAFYAGVMSVVLFVLAITISVASHRSRGLGRERSWRGQPIDYGSSTPNWWMHLRRWWRRRWRF